MEKSFGSIIRQEDRATLVKQSDPLLDVSRGLVNGHSVIHKFGRAEVGTSFVPIALGGVYQTPQAASATALRVKAGGNANDTAAGSGAREVTLQGLDETGALVEEAVATAGASASSPTSTTFMRLFRAWVSASGAYATAAAGSHDADIVIENGAGGTDWATIAATDFARGQSEIGVYSVPLGYSAYIENIIIGVDSSKAADVLMLQRQNILESAAPYTAMRVLLEFAGVSGEEIITPHYPMGPYPALTDILFMGKVATSTGEVDVDFEIILVET